MFLAAIPAVLATRLMRTSMASAPVAALPVTQQSTNAEIADRYGRLPLSFERNEGQTDRAVKFVSRGTGYDFFLTDTGAVLTLRKPRPLEDGFTRPALAEPGTVDQRRNASIIRLNMLGTNPRSPLDGEDQLPGKINYLVGDNPHNWHVDIPTYRKVHYTEIYPKVDLVYYGNRTELEYDFVVAPGGDLQAIRFQFEGIDRMTLDDAGDLHLAVKQDEVTLRKPVIYQLTDEGDRREVTGEYAIKGKEVRFKTAGFDASKPLIIDPVLSYSTLLGAGGNDYATGIAVDSSGSAYITGQTDSGNFPTTPGAFQTGGSVYGASFVTKLDPTGTNLVYSTYISGDSTTTARAIAVDSSGNAYITGQTSASDFPLVNPIKTKGSFFKTTDGAASWNNNNNFSLDVSAIAVAPTAPNTIYAGTFAGPYKSTDGGATWVMTSTTGLPNFPFVTMLSIDPANPLVVYAGIGNGGLYKTIDGGANWNSVSLPLSGAVALSMVFDPLTPTTIYLASGNGVFKSINNGSSWTQLNNFEGITGTPNVRALAIDPTNSAIVYAGTFGSGAFKTTNSGGSWMAINSGMVGTFASNVNALAIDPLNPSVVYAGSGYSGSYGSINKSTNGGSTWAPVNTGVPNYEIKALIADRTNSQTIYAATAGAGVIKTTNGGSSWGLANVGLWRGITISLAVDPTNSAILYAGSGSAGLSDNDSFVSELNASGTGLLFSTYLGGSSSEIGYGIALDGSGNVIVTGQTTSTNFPAVNAIKSTLNASDTFGDGFVTKIHLAGPSIVYSTYLGGDGSDTPYGVAVDTSGNAYVTGTTSSTNFPTLNAFQPAIGDTFNGDAFVTKFNSNGSLGYSTYLGGESLDTGYAIAVDASGNAYVTGQTSSNSFPLVNPIQSTNGNGEAFITKLNGAGSGLIYSTLLGGTGNDVGRGIAVDSAGSAYVCGFTNAADFPAGPGALNTKSPFYQSADGAGTWNNDNYGLKGATVTALALDPTQPSTIYAGTRSNVFKSTNGGQSWNPSGNGLVRPSVGSLVVNPTTPSTLYMAAPFSDFGNSSGVYKSTNGGSTWSAANTGLTNQSVLALAIDPVTPSTLYAGVYGNGIFKSTDGGANWTIQASQTLSFIVAIAIEPTNTKTVYAGGTFSNGAIYKSTDGGINWQSMFSTAVSGLAIDPATPSTIYAGTSQGILKSINAGTTWTSLNQSLTGPVIIDPVTPTTLYTIAGGLNGGVFKSIDSGNNWTLANDGLRSPFVSCLIINPMTPSKVYAGVDVYPIDDDAFVAKLSPSGTALIYSTLLGGSGDLHGSGNPDDEGYAIALDSSGNAYVAGASRAPDFPVTSESYQPFNRGFMDAFISKLMMSYIISGHVLDGSNAPVSGAAVTLSDGASLRSVETEGDGSYQFSRLREGGNFTVSAAKPHFTMTPASQSFTNLHSNQVVDFVATPTGAPFYTISGHVTNNGAALSGVTVTLSGSQQGADTTDSNGLFSFTLAGGGNYTVTPSLLGFTFTPVSQAFNNLSTDQTANFAATRQNFVVTNANDHGAGSLRQAIMDANDTVGTDRIVFNIPGSGVHSINLLVPLPEITDPVVIDATTQPGFAGAPVVELSAAQIDSNAAGFRISAGNSTIRGFVIGGFGWGIFVNGGNGNVIQGNYIGLDPTGTVRHNNNTGIILFNSSNNLIGGTSSAARNVFSGNGSDGISLGGSGNQVQGNFIGTNASGTAAIPNGSNGIVIGGFSSGSNNTVGGTTPGAGNLISGNHRGISSGLTGTVIQGNLIGTNATGTSAIGNDTGIDAAGDALIGGTVPGARNVISGNGLGVSLRGAQSRLQGNFIGTDITGTVALGNTAGGADASDHALIGGTTPAARNIISGNGGWGNITLGFNDGGGEMTTVQGNYIGTDVTGRVALGNSPFGIIAFVSNNVIGGTASGAGNVISGNTVGVQIGGSTSATLTGNLVQGNLIGLTATGDAPLPNRSDGVKLDTASNNTIGGQGNAGNTIAFNGGNGIVVSSGTGNLISGNSIYSNVSLGIDLAPAGVTANDPGDADTGANNRQNFPVLSSATNNGGSIAIQGTFNSYPNATFRLEFFSSPACGSSGYGEGKSFIGSMNVMTDGSGNVTGGFSAGFNVAISNGAAITSTATDPANNTSEFSQCVSLTGPCSYSISPPSQSFPGNGGAGTFNVTVAAGCAWTATSNVGWIDITSGSSGSGNGTVQYSVLGNPGQTIRNGTITIADHVFTVYQGIDFVDVPTTDPFYTDIGKLSARGITLGCGDGNYCPNDAVTREQMAAFIMRARGEFNPPAPPSQRFNDVPPQNIFYNFIDRLAVLQITLGCTPDHSMYCPSDPVKREQMSAFLLRGLGEFDPPIPPSQRFTDVPPANVFYNFIDRLAVLNITLGCTPDHLLYCPNDSVSRAQMAAFLVRAFNL